VGKVGNRCSGFGARLMRCVAVADRLINLWSFCINTCMLIREVIEAKATAELCKSSKPNDALSASDLSSCKSQGLRARTSKRKYKIGGVTQGINGDKVRGKKYGGNLPAHGSKNKENARKGKSEG